MNFPVFDFHCDTALALLGEDFNQAGSLRSNKLHIDLERASKLGGYAQCFACFTTPMMEEWYSISPIVLFEREIATIQREIDANSDMISIVYSTDEIRRNQELAGLVLQGCGGDPQEWLDGINDMFTKNGLLLDGTKFSECTVFQHDGCTCILYPFSENVNLNVGKLALWRVMTHETFGGTWLSDFVENYLGGYAEEQKAEPQKVKPNCPLIGEDGNIFNLMGIAAKTLTRHGMREEVSEMRRRITESGSYDEALGIIGEYVNITSVDDEVCVDEDEGMGMQL